MLVAVFLPMGCESCDSPVKPDLVSGGLAPVKGELSARGSGGTFMSNDRHTQFRRHTYILKAEEVIMIA
jgi:hypothetical protein